MTADAFVEKWERANLTERAGSQEHFLDLCGLLGVETPGSDGEAEHYCFEKHVVPVGAASKGSAGVSGFVDVWKRGHFAWEYKRKGHKDLKDAYRQVYQYREALDNPPLTVVCDIATITIYTHFTGYPTTTETIRLRELPGKLGRLKWVFTAPETFRVNLKPTNELTEEVAKSFKEVADNLSTRLVPKVASAGSVTHQDVAHFLMKVIFCLFAEDIDLLPAQLFTRTVERACRDYEQFPRLAGQLFSTMRTGGELGLDVIPWFNGGLFDERPALALAAGNLLALRKVATKDWAGVAPHIFGTLFERLLDPSKRAQIGAHYTSKDDILLVIEPVVLRPLRREFEGVKNEVTAVLDKKGLKKGAAEAEKLVERFRQRLGEIKVLDPACGSGNFLYVTLQEVLNLDAAMVAWAGGVGVFVDPKPKVRPGQFHGIELNAYAAELAQVVLWIGYLQWHHVRGIDAPKEPVLDKLACIECRDAILDLSDPEHPAAAKWPEADFIVGNPPFLGSKLFRKQGLSDAYVAAVFEAYSDAKGEPLIPRTSDLCCYWFEMARRAIEARAIEKKPGTRAGLIATQGIRGKENRTVLERIKETGDIFMAWSDRLWVLDGAAVQVSMVAFDDGSEKERELDGARVKAVDVMLASGAGLSKAKVLEENNGIAFMGDTKGGSFDVDVATARKLLAVPKIRQGIMSPLVPWMNGADLTRRPRGMFIIDFGVDMEEADASIHQAPFEYVTRHVKPERLKNRREAYARKWWLHVEPRPDLRQSLGGRKYIATARVSKHRLFAGFDGIVLPDSAVIAFARSDEYFFGVMHSSVHELWALRMGTQLENRPRYTPTTCFETFALPWSPRKEDVKSKAHTRVSEAGRKLNELRENWLNPREWVEALAARIDREDDFRDVPKEARAMVREATIAAAAAKDVRLKKRTLTKLYNERPAWLRHAHEELDRAVLAAYAETDEGGGWEEAWAEVYVETGAGRPLVKGHKLEKRRGEVDQKILGSLLRLNGERG